MRFDLVWSEEAEAHAWRHGVRWSQVEEVLRGAFYTRRIRGGRIVIGRAADGTIFLVLGASREFRGSAELVTARFAKASEKRLLHRRGKGVQ